MATADELLRQGAITEEDAAAVRDFAAILRKAGPREGATAEQRAYRRWQMNRDLGDFSDRGR